MTKHARKSDYLQLIDERATAAVQIPRLIPGAYASTERSSFELRVTAGQRVLSAMMEQDRENLYGSRWQRDPEGKAGRGGTTRSEITLRGRRAPITRPRARSADGAELERPGLAFAASRDALDPHTIEAVDFGVSNRKSGGAQVRSGEGTMSRHFIMSDNQRYHK